MQTDQLDTMQKQFSRFDAFKTCDDPVLVAMKAATMGWTLKAIEGWKPKHWLSLTGDSGTGKTYLCRMALDVIKTDTALMRHSWLSCPVIYSYWPTLLNRLRDGEYYRLTDMISANVVLLDELTIDHDPSGFAADKLCHILSGRVGKWTLITSNLTIERIEELDRRIASRMVRDGSKILNCNTQDYAMRGI
jgi:DNA replication protein DnaC